MKADTALCLGHRPALDGVRAAAILLMFAHAGFYGASALAPGGGVRVKVFFALSGFLITTLLLEEHAPRTSRPAARLDFRLPRVVDLLRATGRCRLATLVFFCTRFRILVRAHEAGCERACRTAYSDA